MRQPGLLGAACVYALDHHLPRLADAHALVAAAACAPSRPVPAPA